MVTLVVMDGLGYRTEEYGNAVLAAGMPNMDKLKAMFPFTTLQCCGRAVGLEEGQMGGSEVGHLNMGAGRVVFQDLTKINNSIEDGSFFENKVLLDAINHIKLTGGKLHIMGLLSDGGIHSKTSHLKALVDLAQKHNVKNICIHAFTDGRDTLKDSGINFVKQTEEYLPSNARICTVMGRFYAMDREQRYDRTQKAYDALVLGRADNYFQSAQEYLKQSYSSGVFDEFVEPCIIGKPQKIESGDSVIFFNYRADRARELTQAIAEQNVQSMQLARLHDVCYVCFTQYNKDFKNVHIAFAPETVDDNLACILSQNGKKQYHISETTKYAHVTFFFNGGIEKPYPGEDRLLIESENVKNFAETPNMKAVEITQNVLEQLSTGKYDFVIVNLSNADMVGHTGDFEATKQAVRMVDKCAYAIALATLSIGGDCIVTADHGNADVMLDKDGNIVTSHSMSPVPLYLVSQGYKDQKLCADGKLANIAPTILKLLDLQIPASMDKPLF